ncbi:Uncharacterised protein [Candidatus Tiddalikarchaeum anstoanum]|nr:Uncharacterised protein [Candidatus Tiddalikarchaeum anstoanum]
MVYPAKWTCPNCKKLVFESKSCKFCGLKFPMHYPNLWHCPNCGKLIDNSTHCNSCNYPNILEYPKLWHCTKCGELVKMQEKCPKCASQKVMHPSSTQALSSLSKHVKRLKPQYLALPLNIILIIIALAFISNVLVRHVVISQPNNVTYKLGGASMELPMWSVLERGDSSIFLQDLGTLQSMNFFIHTPYYSLPSSELTKIYDSISRQTPANISSEYDYNNWHVLCFDASSYNSCISIAQCDGNNVFVQLISFNNNFNHTLFYSTLNSLCCNC